MPGSDSATGHLAGLVAGITVTVLLLTAALLLLARPLAVTMIELGGAQHRGRFWATLGGAALTAGTLLAAFTGYWWHATAPVGAPLTSGGREPEAAWAAVDMVRWALAALACGVAALAAMVLSSTATSPNVGGRQGSCDT